jgi:release factor glutamine methyltransferase
MTENELLLTNLLNCRRVDLYTGDYKFSDDQKEQLSYMQQLRAHHEPLQYILGSCEFMGLDFVVDHRALIPRPETEFLTETVIRHISHSRRKALRILDIGTGSGNIIVSLAHYLGCHSFTAVDISIEALSLAQENAQKHGVQERIDFIVLDALKDLHDLCVANSRFDIVVSNPPYIPRDEISRLSLEVQKEPHLALDGGKEGLDFYCAITRAAEQLLNPQGMIFLEIGDGQAEKIKEIVSSCSDLMVQSCIRDYTDTERILVLKR